MKLAFPRQGSALAGLWALEKTKAMLSPTGYSMMMINFLPALWSNLQFVQEPNQQASTSTESKGCTVPDPATFDLMSDLVGGSADFDPVAYLGYSFVCADTHCIPHKTTVIDVDEETGHILLEYIHGETEWVEPNIL